MEKVWSKPGAPGAAALEPLEMSVPLPIAPAAGRARRAWLLETDAAGELSHRAVLVAPAILCAMMLAVGLATALASGVNGLGLIVPYFAAAWGALATSILVFSFIVIAGLARKRAERPLREVVGRVRERAVLLLLPALVFPLFLVGFTTSKTAIPFLVGFRWDSFWADVDAVIFGGDVWKLTHGVFGKSSVPVWEWFYTIAWGYVLMFSKALVPLFASPRRVAVFFTAMLGTWFFGGWLTAYAVSAAGPVFAHLVDPGLADRFEPLRAALAGGLVDGGSVSRTQAYLANAIVTAEAVRGGGVSAMPSMHLGAASIYLIAAWRTKWAIPAAAFWAIIFIGSGYFGYHYWVDGIIAAGIAYLCWKAAENLFADPPAAELRLAAIPAGCPSART